MFQSKVFKIALTILRSSAILNVWHVCGKWNHVERPRPQYVGNFNPNCSQTKVNGRFLTFITAPNKRLLKQMPPLIIVIICG